MKRLVTAACITAAFSPVAIIPSPALAAYFTNGNQLYEFCTARESSATYLQDGTRCHAFIVGVFDDLMLVREGMGLPECTASSITVGQLGDVVRKYLSDHPAIRNFSGALLVRMAIVDAWPSCGLNPSTD